MASLASVQRWFRCTRVCRMGLGQLQSGLVSGIGDVVAQTYVEETPFDKGPMIQKTTYRLVSQFGQIRCPMTVPTSIAIEQLMVAPLVNASVIAYSRIISGDEWPQVKEKTKETFIPVTVNGLMLWPVAQLVSHALGPLDPRGLFIAAVGLGWSTYLSHVTLGDGKAEIFNPFAEEDKSKKKSDKKPDKKAAKNKKK
ncbi:uncharacterized protein LOC126836999 [Adelges cooleyi]|uniref:uncharacterized protein LOC126836999 n=1 Tax=Adelges cooleyi TaxID=133065 RepID=UPI00217F9447|nr:uncharacterized protein LOC126836999 [Adelges cooleyi]